MWPPPSYGRIPAVPKRPPLPRTCRPAQPPFPANPNCSPSPNPIIRPLLIPPFGPLATGEKQFRQPPAHPLPTAVPQPVGAPLVGALRGPKRCKAVLRSPSWKKGIKMFFAALRGQKVFFVVLSGPSWKKGVPPSPPRIKSCPSRPFADKRFSSWSLVALRGKKVFLPALRGSKSCPSRPFADKRFSSWSLVALRGKKVFLPALRGSKSCPSRPFADKRFSSWSLVALRGQKVFFAFLRDPSRTKKGVSRNPSRIDQALISQFPTQPNVNQPYPLPLPFPYPLPLPVPTNPFPTQRLYSILTCRRKSGPSKTAAPSVSPQTQN